MSEDDNNSNPTCSADNPGGTQLYSSNAQPESSSEVFIVDVVGVVGVGVVVTGGVVNGGVAICGLTPSFELQLIFLLEKLLLKTLKLVKLPKNKAPSPTISTV